MSAKCTRSLLPKTGPVAVICILYMYPMTACYDHGLKVEQLKHLFCLFFYIVAYFCELNTNPANKVAHVMSLTYASWCAYPTDYMNKPG